MEEQELSDEQRRKLAELDRSSAYVALWFAMFAVVVIIAVVAVMKARGAF